MMMMMMMMIAMMTNFVLLCTLNQKPKALFWAQNPEDKEGNDNPAAAKTFSETCQTSTIDFHSFTVFTKISTLDVY